VQLCIQACAWCLAALTIMSVLADSAALAPNSAFDGEFADKSMLDT